MNLYCLSIVDWTGGIKQGKDQEEGKTNKKKNSA